LSKRQQRLRDLRDGEFFGMHSHVSLLPKNLLGEGAL
jgi:hypothetical protein